MMTLFDKEAEVNTPPYFTTPLVPVLPSLSCEASDEPWKFQLPAVKDEEAHPYKATLLLPEALEGFITLDSSKMLIQKVEGQKLSRPSRSSDVGQDLELKVVLTDEVGLSTKYSLTVPIDCKDDALNSTVAVKPRISSISNLGVVKIAFSHPLEANHNLTQL